MSQSMHLLIKGLRKFKFILDESQMSLVSPLRFFQHTMLLFCPSVHILDCALLRLCFTHQKSPFHVLYICAKAVMTICPVACQACNILRGILWMRMTKEASLASLANLHNNNVLKLNQTMQFLSYFP